jgi:hypothetical protein
MQIRTAPKNIKKGEAVFDISEITETWALPYCKFQSLDHVFVEPKLSDLCQNCGKVMNSDDNCHTLNYSLLKEVLGFDFQIGSQFEYDLRFCSSKCFCKAQFMFGPILSSLKKIAPDLVSYWKKRLCVRIMDQDDVSILVATCMFWNFSQHFNFISKIHHESTRQSFNKTIDDALYEYWIILYSSLPSVSDSDGSTLFSVDVFDSIVKAIRRRCFLTQPDVYRLSNVTDALFKSTSNLDVKINTVLSEFNRCLNGFSALYEKSLTQVTSTELAAWRAISRVSQGITETIENDTDFSNELNDGLLETLRNFSPHFTVIIPYLEFTHSCIPNGFLEKREDKVVLIALHDIFIGEQITVSLIDNLEADVTTRGLLLRSIYEKDFQCMCFRCNIERIDINRLDEAKGGHQWYEWKRMGDLSMQYSRFRQALKYYDMALQSSNLIDTERGDILHARAATFLGRRQFVKACEVWNDAYSKVSSHTGIKLQVTKTISYKDPGNGCSTSQGSTYSYETLIPSKCFMTKGAVVTKLECKQAIQWAEEASVYLPGGWTTSRHYAVPTTDIPVHQIPKLLSWFKNVFYTRLKPLLGQQFGTKEVGENGSAVHIHDAFIVRYDSQGGQRHLPLHRDESTHSFTIALNSLGEYEGGGTYISQLQTSLKPERGGVVSFRGSDLLHGGDPVIRGTRYIIVAFCYADFAGLDKEQNQKVKKQKLENCSSNFSFEFQF